MAFFILALLAVLASSLVSADSVGGASLKNGQKAQTLNSEFENLHVNDFCNSTHSQLP